MNFVKVGRKQTNKPTQTGQKQYVPQYRLWDIKKFKVNYQGQDHIVLLQSYDISLSSGHYIDKILYPLEIAQRKYGVLYVSWKSVTEVKVKVTLTK